MGWHISFFEDYLEIFPSCSSSRPYANVWGRLEESQQYVHYALDAHIDFLGKEGNVGRGIAFFFAEVLY